MHQGTYLSFILCVIYGVALKLGHGNHDVAHARSFLDGKESSDLSDTHQDKRSNATRREVTGRRVEDMVSERSGEVVSTRGWLGEVGTGVGSVEGGSDEAALRHRAKTKNSRRVTGRRKKRKRRRWWRNRIHRAKKKKNDNYVHGTPSQPLTRQLGLGDIPLSQQVSGKEDTGDGYLDRKVKEVVQKMIEKETEAELVFIEDMKALYSVIRAMPPDLSQSNGQNNQNGGQNQGTNQNGGGSQNQGNNQNGGGNQNQGNNQNGGGNQGQGNNQSEGGDQNQGNNQNGGDNQNQGNNQNGGDNQNQGNNQNGGSDQNQGNNQNEVSNQYQGNNQNEVSNQYQGNNQNGGGEQNQRFNGNEGERYNEDSQSIAGNLHFNQIQKSQINNQGTINQSNFAKENGIKSGPSNPRNIIKDIEMSDVLAKEPKVHEVDEYEREIIKDFMTERSPDNLPVKGPQVVQSIKKTLKNSSSFHKEHFLSLKKNNRNSTQPFTRQLGLGDIPLSQQVSGKEDTGDGYLDRKVAEVVQKMVEKETEAELVFIEDMKALYSVIRAMPPNLSESNGQSNQNGGQNQGTNQNGGGNQNQGNNQNGGQNQGSNGAGNGGGGNQNGNQNEGGGNQNGNQNQDSTNQNGNQNQGGENQNRDENQGGGNTNGNNNGSGSYMKREECSGTKSCTIHIIPQKKIQAERKIDEYGREIVSDFSVM